MNHTKQSPTPPPWHTDGRGNVFDAHGNHIAVCHPYGVGFGPVGYVCPWHSYDANATLIARAVNSHADLLAALKDLLEQTTGPAQVYGDGIGNDGTKTGLTHWEFNALRDERISNARKAIAQADGDKCAQLTNDPDHSSQ